MLRLENINWKTPDGVGIIDGLDLDVSEGRLIVITGPNGGGKTTLAKIIAGIIKPDSGSIFLDGEDITSLDVTERAKRGISFAFQQPVRFKGITVRKLIELASGGNMKESNMCDVLSQVGLCARDYIDREVNSTLSGVLKSRLCLQGIRVLQYSTSRKPASTSGASAISSMCSNV